MKITFDFEKPIGELQQQIEKVEQVEEKNKVDMSGALAELRDNLHAKQEEIYGNLSG